MSLLVVQKFGGTSVADPDAIQRLIQIVRTARSRGGRGQAVVVSAMSGVTDALLAIAAAAGAGEVDGALARLDQLRERHLSAARELAAHDAGGPLGASINAQFDDLVALA